jgi:hypothetical protein
MAFGAKMLNPNDKVLSDPFRQSPGGRHFKYSNQNIKLFGGKFFDNKKTNIVHASHKRQNTLSLSHMQIIQLKSFSLRYLISAFFVAIF